MNISYYILKSIGTFVKTTPPYCPKCGSGALENFYDYGVKRICTTCGEAEPMPKHKE